MANNSRPNAENVQTGAPSTLAPNQANAEGTSKSLARADHTHEIVTGAPSTIGTSNAEGGSSSFSRQDHVHDHGEQTEPTHHAAATPSAAGFMSGTDKADFDRLNEIPLVMNEPTGFPNRTDSVISFNESTRVFTIEPVSTSFTVYVRGKKFTYDTAQTVTIPDVSGSYSVVFNDAGVLISTTVFSAALFDQNAWVSYIYWNSVQGKAVVFSEERHGLSMDGQTHFYLHTTRGTQLVSGASVGFTFGSGANNSDMQVSLSDMMIADEDIRTAISNNASPSNPFEQILSPAAEIPVIYRSGSIWARDVATVFPLKQGTSRPQYNLFDSTWSMVDASQDGKVIAYYIFATSNLIEPVISIPGQHEYDTLADALNDAAWSRIDLTDLPFPEIKLLYILLIETSAVFTNTPKARILEIRDVRFGVDREFSAYSQNTDHANLSGLANDDHLQYLNRSGTRPMEGTFNMGSNPITNVTTINAVTVEAHASRHNPGGADPLATGAASTINANTANAEGNATSFARSNHTHEIPTATPVTLNAGANNNAGNSAELARANHVHQIATDSAVGLTANTTNTEGSSTSLARANHTHEIATATAVQVTPDQTNAEGNSTGLARANHVHNIPTAAAVTISTSSANAQGNADTFARSNHTHKVELTSDTVSAVSSVTNSGGTPVLLNGMTITPPAGTYNVEAFFMGRHNQNNGNWNGSLFSGGVLVPNTQYTVDRGGSQGDCTIDWQCKAQVTVNGSQAIQIRIATPAGTTTVTGRSLSILRVA
jgi:hypothetical protein